MKAIACLLVFASVMFGCNQSSIEPTASLSVTDKARCDSVGWDTVTKRCDR